MFSLCFEMLVLPLQMLYDIYVVDPVLMSSVVRMTGLLWNFGNLKPLSYLVYSIC